MCAVMQSCRDRHTAQNTSGPPLLGSSPGFSTSAAEEIVRAEEMIAMQEFDEWLDEVDATSYYTDIDN